MNSRALVVLIATAVLYLCPHSECAEISQTPHATPVFSAPRWSPADLRNEVRQSDAVTYELGSPQYQILNPDEQPEIITEDQPNYLENLRRYDKNSGIVWSDRNAPFAAITAPKSRILIEELERDNDTSYAYAKRQSDKVKFIILNAKPTFKVKSTPQATPQKSASRRKLKARVQQKVEAVERVPVEHPKYGEQKLQSYEEWQQTQQQNAQAKALQVQEQQQLQQQQEKQLKQQQKRLKPPQLKQQKRKQLKQQQQGQQLMQSAEYQQQEAAPRMLSSLALQPRAQEQQQQRYAIEQQQQQQQQQEQQQQQQEQQQQYSWQQTQEQQQELLAASLQHRAQQRQQFEQQQRAEEQQELARRQLQLRAQQQYAWQQQQQQERKQREEYEKERERDRAHLEQERERERERGEKAQSRQLSKTTIQFQMQQQQFKWQQQSEQQRQEVEELQEAEEPIPARSEQPPRWQEQDQQQGYSTKTPKRLRVQTTTTLLPKLSTTNVSNSEALHADTANIVAKDENNNFAADFSANTRVSAVINSELNATIPETVTPLNNFKVVNTQSSTEPPPFPGPQPIISHYSPPATLYYPTLPGMSPYYKPTAFPYHSQPTPLVPYSTLYGAYAPAQRRSYDAYAPPHVRDFEFLYRSALGLK